MEEALIYDKIYKSPFVGTGSIAFPDSGEAYIPQTREPSTSPISPIIWDGIFNVGTTRLINPSIYIFNTAGAISGVSPDYCDELASKSNNYYLLKLLGDNGVKRLKIFQNSKAGWDNGRGMILKDTSLQMLSSFSHHFSNAQAKNVSLFMTEDGYLSILQRDKDGKVIELEFHEDSIEYYFEGNGEEGEVDSLHIDELAKRIEILLAYNFKLYHLSA